MNKDDLAGGKMRKALADEVRRKYKDGEIDTITLGRGYASIGAKSKIRASLQLILNVDIDETSFSDVQVRKMRIGMYRSDWTLLVREDDRRVVVFLRDESLEKWMDAREIQVNWEEQKSVEREAGRWAR